MSFIQLLMQFQLIKMNIEVNTHIKSINESITSNSKIKNNIEYFNKIFIRKDPPFDTLT